MNIGFDAKRAYHNTTGLGYYSRTLVELMATHYPEHSYYLFNPKPSKRYSFNAYPNLNEILPAGFLHKTFSSYWRSSAVSKQLDKMGIDLYHGLSHEIPVGINKTRVKSVVTIHDLIHERFPEQYKAIDRKIYTRKYQHACKQADKIIAISQQTKDDLIELYKTPEEKIVVCYQSCSPLFGQKIPDGDKIKIREKYKLPSRFFLSVGTINERKNLLNVCKAIYLLRNDTDIPLVIVGKGKGEYYQKVKDFILQHKLEKSVIFLSEEPAARSDRSWLQTEDLAIIYQLAELMIYPSYFEGFGLPILEAISSGTPVITTRESCLEEIGGEGSWYVNPSVAEEMADAMLQISGDKLKRDEMVQKGLEHAQNFAPEKYVASVMNIYKSL